jgi:hypothetical protein
MQNVVFIERVERVQGRPDRMTNEHVAVTAVFVRREMEVRGVARPDVLARTLRVEPAERQVRKQLNGLAPSRVPL